MAEAARRRRSIVAAALLALWPLVEGGRVALWRAPRATAPPADGRPRALVAVHVHTRAAGGRGSLEDVVAASRAAGLDAVVVTDHDSLAHLAAEGWHDGVLVLVGIERDADAGHLLVPGLDRPPFPLAPEAEEAAADARAAGGIAVAAHPLRRGQADLRWRGGLDALDGVEIANLDAALRESPGRWPGALVAAPFGVVRALSRAAGAERGALALLDRMLERRPAAALAAADAHGFPGYAAALGAVVNVAILERPLSGDLAADRAAVRRALAGRSLVAWPAVADPGGASFLARRDGEMYLPGDVAPGGGPLALELRSGLDVEADLVILHRGKPVARTRGRRLSHTASTPGAYRAEVSIPGAPHAPWLVANAIGLAGPGWPEPDEDGKAEPPSGGAAAVDLLARMRGEHDPRSRLEVTTQGGGARLEFALGHPDAARPDVWIALVDRTGTIDLGLHRRLVLEAEADRPLRLAAGFDFAASRRARTIRLGPKRSVHRIALDGLAPPAGERAGRALLTVDGGLAWPGSSGVVVVHALRLE